MEGEVIPLGSRLRRRRAELGLTQAQAARELDVARTAYRLWEMEAARPAPDRWRVIAKWLGMSMTALLLAEELLDHEEAAGARSAVGAGLSERDWDAQSAASGSDLFSPEGTMILPHTQTGDVSEDEAASLLHFLSRVRGATAEPGPAPWYPGRFRKRFANTNTAPALARAALLATAHGIGAEAFEHAALLTSELVTNSVRHSGSDWVELVIILEPGLLRIEVVDSNGRSTIRPRTPDVHGGWGMALIGELAPRWGVDRRSNCKAVWVEFDLASAS